MNDHDYQAAASLASAIIGARAAGKPETLQMILTTPEEAAAIYLDCIDAIDAAREKRGLNTITRNPLTVF